MSKQFANAGLVLNEPLLWEKGGKGKSAFSMPKQDVEKAYIDEEITGEGPDFPELSEIDIARHYTRLSTWNFGVDTGMYPLGSCTMKYNPKINEKLAALSGWGANPLVEPELNQGALEVMFRLADFLKEITGMDAVSLQPAAGAHGELAGMLICYAYFKSKNSVRKKIIIPDTAHGTNPASAALCGFKPVAVKSGQNGVLLPETIAVVMDEDTAGIMITNPNTLGLFEENIKEIAEIVHAKGGLVYCDGANMNAIMGISSPGEIGIDVIHLNLHKTFSTPHGGGGPGAGPVCVNKKLEPFLPTPRIIKQDNKYVASEEFPQSIGRLHTFFGNFGVMLKAYCYIMSMGDKYLKKASELAVLNANYIRACLKEDLEIPYDGLCMHECVFSDKKLEQYKVATLDLAKRLIEYGYHPPTIYFPLIVKGAIMIEPTETESKEEIDGLIEAIKSILKEAKENPQLLLDAPEITKVRRLDETGAARKPRLTAFA
ncbi:MAG: aminomethyl-transferring glycine dehydrogenase subunit GcvPB [Deltaproteobacteria bacterium]|nr:aminomethyl-transferring glycine dehydrogenase subunit GcvPB [Deltaproteobacteria bacterium]